jgi:hypothetical protein
LSAIGILQQLSSLLKSPPGLFTFDQLLALAVAYHLCQPALEEVMENIAELIQRLLEIQSGARQRSPELIAEDELLMDRLQKRTLAGSSTQTIKLSPIAECRSDSALNFSH